MFKETRHTYETTKEEIETLNTKLTESHPMLSLNHEVIVAWFCESDISHIYFSKRFVENK